jgi:hypothetical protein
VLVSFVYVVACRLFAFVPLLARSDRSKELEILLLRHELSILQRQARRPQPTESDRLVLAISNVLTERPTCERRISAVEPILRRQRPFIRCR